jgi:hypothetical protein
MFQETRSPINPISGVIIARELFRMITGIALNPSTTICYWNETHHSVQNR